MKKLRVLALLLSLCLLLTSTACQSEQDALYSEAVSKQEGQSVAEPSVDPNDPGYLGEPTPEPGTVFTPVPNDDLSGEQTIKCYHRVDPSVAYHLAQEFMKLHPNVTINFDYEITTSERNTLSMSEREIREKNYYAQVGVELASGEADYLLYSFEDGLDLASLSRNGILYDMTEFWENDPDIKEEEYFMPVIESCKVDGKLTSIPYGFYYPSVTFSQRVLDEVGIDLTGYEKIRVDTLLELYQQAQAKKPELNLFFSSPGKDELFAYEQLDHIDFENGTCDFTSPEFLEFLEKTKLVGNSDPELTEREIGLGQPGLGRYCEEYRETQVVPYEITLYAERHNNVVTKSKEWFATTYMETHLTSFTLQSPLEYMTVPYPLLSTEGKLGIRTVDGFAMPSSLKNKELAWEFIKYCLSAREDPSVYELTGFRWLCSEGFYSNTTITDVLRQS